MKNSFRILILFALLISNFLYASDACSVGTGYSQNPLVAGSSFSKSDTVSGNSSSSTAYDNYYFKAPAAGKITITLTGSNVAYSYGLTTCPSSSGGTTSSTTLTLSS